MLPRPWLLNTSTTVLPRCSRSFFDAFARSLAALDATGYLRGRCQCRPDQALLQEGGLIRHC